jgi:hypothetical protein
MCLICGEGMGYFDDGSPCWGCNFRYCPDCQKPVFDKGLCEECLTKHLRGLLGVKECQRIEKPPYLRRVK